MSKDISFGTDGWRAVMADTFTFDNLGKVSRAIARYITSERHISGTHRPRLIIGYDNRFLGREFADRVARECSAFSVDCLISEKPVPTPVTAFAIKSFRASGAVMLTASHNPYYFNGIKFIPEYAGPATPEITTSIEMNLAHEQGSAPGTAPGIIEEADITRDYISHIESCLDMPALRGYGLKVACDPLHGAGIDLAGELLEMSGLDFEMIHSERDVTFGGGLPDPSEERLGDLKRLVTESRLDAGLGLDGDADRIGIIAENGVYLSANKVIALLLAHLVTHRHMRGKVVRTVATTHLIDSVASDLGIDVVETPVGFKYVGQEMMNGDVVIGGEESGGLSVGGHIPEKDGLLADLLVCEMLAAEQRPLSVLMDEMHSKYGLFLNKRLDIEYPEVKKKGLFALLKDSPPVMVAGKEVTDVSSLDGYRLSLEDGSWMLFRASGTEPLIRVYVETFSEEMLSRIEAAALELLDAS